MRKEHGLVLTKSTAICNVARKNWTIKRKKCMLKKEFAKHRDSNSSKVKYNQCCNTNGLEDYKVELEKWTSQIRLN